jgi:hypothetical protein
MYIRCSGDVFTKPLPSNNGDFYIQLLPSNNREIHIQTHGLTGGNYEECCKDTETAWWSQRNRITVWLSGDIKDNTRWSAETLHILIVSHIWGAIRKFLD